MKTLALCVMGALSWSVHAQGDLWEEGAQVPANGRGNVFGLNEAELSKKVERGKIHSLNYPVEVSGVLLPYDATRRGLEKEDSPGLVGLFQYIRRTLGLNPSLEDLQKWLGLHPYPHTMPPHLEGIPRPKGLDEDLYMGASLVQSDNGIGFTFSCSACHTGQLFGTPIFGLPNRFPRANRFFNLGKKAMGAIPLDVIQYAVDASPAETIMFRNLKTNLNAVGGRDPQTLGLDTSLAHVALSLARRTLDPQASKNTWFEKFPRYDRLQSYPADSKPGTWWLVKYKNRWLSDGSVVSGNPIYTNILWNEIGRGTDLVVLNRWFAANTEIIKELTATVFANQAPLMTDFFDFNEEDLVAAREGEKLFNKTCSRCHGNYEKAWHQPELYSGADLLKTVAVLYPEDTAVIDVGTDPLRWQGMSSLLQLNDLEISQQNDITIRTQKGYVPPPLVGIWARWPYFHNNSAPSLCAVLTPGNQRPETYYAGEALSKTRDFDRDCNGYPTGSDVPLSWKQSFEKRFDSKKTGQGRLGHDEGIFVENGQNLLSDTDKFNLIRFLQTL